MFKSILNTLNGHSRDSASDAKQPVVSITHELELPKELRESSANEPSGLCNGSDGGESLIKRSSANHQLQQSGNNAGRNNASKKSGRKKLSAMMGKIHSSMVQHNGSKSKQQQVEANNNNGTALNHADFQASGENGADDDEDDNDIYDDSTSNPEELNKKMASCAVSASYKKGDKFILPEEQCDIPTFLHTENCDRHLIDETRRLLRERYAKNPENFYDDDFKRMLTDDWTVSRFLLRRRLDPKRTAKLMEECGRFRKQYKMSEVKLWEFPVEFHKAGGLFKYAKDRVGNGTVYMRVKMYRRVPEISDVFKAWILCVLEECDMDNGGRGTAVIFDLTGCGLQNVDLGFLSWLLSSFRNYCPKGVSYILVYNLPWILNATCKLAMTWMSASNRRALRFVYGDEIENFIARENLPDYCGGTCKLSYRSVPEGSLPATEVCDRLDMTREQALKIRDMFKEYLASDDETEVLEGEENGKSAQAHVKH